MSSKFTPHARGSTAKEGTTMKKIEVYPACAGIDLFVRRKKKMGVSLPRMRGDRPLLRFF